MPTNTDTPQNTPPEEFFVQEEERRPFHQLEVMAMILKFQGHTYPEISEKVGLTVNTLKCLFKRGEPLYGAYWRYAREQAHQMGKEAQIAMQKEMATAVGVVKEMMTDKETPHAVRLRAAMYLLDRVSPAVDAEQERRDNFLDKLGEIGFKYKIEDSQKLHRTLKGMEEAEDYM